MSNIRTFVLRIDLSRRENFERKIMKKYLIAVCSVAVILVTSGCVVSDGQRRGGVYQQDNVQYDGYYDGYYGPYTSGYWGGDGFFYYQDRDRQYRRDDSRHFRREQFNGGQGIRGNDRGRQDQGNYHRGQYDDDRNNKHRRDY